MRLIDLHCDTVSKLANPWSRGTLAANPYSVDLVRLAAADSLLQCFSTFFHTGCIPGPVRVTAAFRMADRRIDVFEKNLRQCAGKMIAVQKFSDIERCEKQGCFGALLTMEDGVPIGHSLENLRHFYKRGIRLVTLTWNYENAIGYPNSKDARVMSRGLKPFGFAAVEEMNRLGIAVDVSHLSDGGFWDVATTSKKPFIASHSNARAVTNHPRNLTDEMIRAIAEHGGVIGLNFCPKFLGRDNRSRISDMLRHIRHIYRVGGEDVLAIGSDFDGITGDLQIRGTQDMHLLAEALRRHHMPERVLEKMWSQNALRVLREILN